MLTTKKSSLAIAAGSLLTATLAFSPLVGADSNPFASAELSSGYMQLAEKDAEGKCGEAKCGEDMKDGEGKCGEAKCGEDMKDGEGKCGEAKCGEAMNDTEVKEINEASCGGLFHERVFSKKV